MSVKPDLTLIAAHVPTELADQLKARAVAAERSLSGEVRLALRAYLEAPEEAAA